jgi:hypothetical protein
LDQVDLPSFITEFVHEPDVLNCEQKEYQIKWKDTIDKALKEITKRGLGNYE